mmetsp:Transcript_16883/g.23894  ORF Transcript_16883/g.23894 Transcript_16883/m.23894 type:complete len:247 (+) Transcript_16883:100-840(+)|eukprot:CAMPEP_0184855198 /NCGR_PEP_ID=MMETSP0580-20130426/511_1 /TAXON_ID=1118495 /ORGANISM="Dactyliosolen fragilissimus" /LENGTH=246 /DNA_ID=CAMNT_0027349651 /DNA_START=32 /DNA_END=772 /DNA_ORIENTATION=-
MSKNNEESESSMIEDIPLSPPSSSHKSVTQSFQTSENKDSKSNPDETEKPESEDADVDALLHEISEDPPPSNTYPPSEGEGNNDKAIVKLRESTARLGSVIGDVSRGIDTKLGVSASVKNVNEKLHVSERLKGVNESLHVSDRVGQTTSTINSWWSNARQSVQGVTAGPIDNMKDSFRNSGINNAFERLNQSLKTFDEQHKVTTRTAEGLAFGADFLSETLKGGVADGKKKSDEDPLDDFDGETDA